MKPLLIIFFSLNILLSPATRAVNAETAAATAKAPIVKENSRAALDKLVRDYERAVKSAQSIEVLTDFLPAPRLKKLRNCKPKERADWLRFRRTMPPIVMLVKLNEYKDKAVLIYSCADSPSRSGRKKTKMMEKVTVVREDAKWKVALEHFGPAKIIMPTHKPQHN